MNPITSKFVILPNLYFFRKSSWGSVLALFNISLTSRRASVPTLLPCFSKNKLNIPIFAIVDTNSDPTIIDFPIPANDDAAKSISIISRTIADAVAESSQKVKEKQSVEQAKQVEEKPEVETEKSEKKPSKKKAKDVTKGE